MAIQKGVDGPKLKPFLNKKFVVVPRKMEPMYYEKFVSPLVAAFDVYAKGFEINTERYPLITELNFSELATVSSATPSLFESSSKSGQADDGLSKLLFKLSNPKLNFF